MIRLTLILALLAATPAAAKIAPSRSDPGVPSPAQNVLNHLNQQQLIFGIRIERLPERNQTLCLALAMYHEARALPENDRQAVAQVIVNRSQHSGQTVCATLWERGGTQFPWVQRSAARLRPRESAIWHVIQEQALAFRRHRPDDLTHGATHFYNPDLCDPDWAKQGQVTARLGHVFLRLASH